MAARHPRRAGQHDVEGGRGVTLDELLPCIRCGWMRPDCTCAAKPWPPLPRPQRQDPTDINPDPGPNQTEPVPPHKHPAVIGANHLVANLLGRTA
jgi:hypothetical protein